MTCEETNTVEDQTELNWRSETSQYHSYNLVGCPDSNVSTEPFPGYVREQQKQAALKRISLDTDMDFSSDRLISGDSRLSALLAPTVNGPTTLLSMFQVRADLSRHATPVG